MTASKQPSIRWQGKELGYDATQSKCDAKQSSRLGGMAGEKKLPASGGRSRAHTRLHAHARAYARTRLHGHTYAYARLTCACERHMHARTHPHTRTRIRTHARIHSISQGCPFALAPYVTMLEQVIKHMDITPPPAITTDRPRHHDIKSRRLPTSESLPPSTGESAP